jgi:hypothetical protein
MSLGRNIKLIGHEIFHVAGPEIKDLPKIDNIVYKAGIPELKWVEELTLNIGEWRDIMRSTYIRWAVAINGLFVAGEKYKDLKWKQNNKFQVSGFRMGNGVNPTIATLVEWDGDTAAEAHLKSVSMIASYGVIDLYACFEEWIFSFYRTYLESNPGNFIVGPENRPLRRLYENKASDPEAWNLAWKERLDKWQRKKLYEGLDLIFLSFMNVTGLQKPKSYVHTTPETWAEKIKEISILRNCLIHGEKKIPEELAVISNKPNGLGFKFTTGEEIKLSTNHLMSIELFADQLLTAINLSIVEKAEKEFIKYSS